MIHLVDHEDITGSTRKIFSHPLSKHAQGSSRDMLRTSGDGPENIGDILRPCSPQTVTSQPLRLLLAPSFPGVRPTHPLPYRSQREGGIIPRVSHLRRDSSESEHLAGSDRKPASYPNCTGYGFRDGIVDTAGKKVFYPLRSTHRNCHAPSGNDIYEQQCPGKVGGIVRQ